MSWRPWIALALAACGASSVPPPTAQSCAPIAIDPSPSWAGSNAQTLTAWIDSAGCASPSFDPAHPPVALFDWDDTIAKNDFGDALTYWMIAHGKIHRPPSGDWRATSPFLTAAAAEALARACNADDPVPSDRDAACADALLSVYEHGTEQHLFAGHDPAHMEPAFAWTAQLLAGYTHAEIRAFAKQMSDAELAAPHGATQTVGTHAETAWLRIYPEQRSLIRALASRGYDVWVVTASPEDAIAVVAPLAGVAADHVVGLTSRTDAAGRLTAHLAGCGGVPDDQIINYKAGKRCAANHYVFGDRAGAHAAFAAGDSDSDVAMLADATYRLALDRNKPGLMCAARAPNWLVNPMFIDPIAPFSGSCR